MLGFRKAANQALSSGSGAAGRIGDGLSTAGRTASNSARYAYGYAMNHPKASAAVVLGTGVAAALLWLVRRNGGFRSIYQETLGRVRAKPRPRTRSRAHRAAAR
jgi:hypothetical protein